VFEDEERKVARDGVLRVVADVRSRGSLGDSRSLGSASSFNPPRMGTGGGGANGIGRGRGPASGSVVRSQSRGGPGGSQQDGTRIDHGDPDTPA